MLIFSFARSPNTTLTNGRTSQTMTQGLGKLSFDQSLSPHFKHWPRGEITRFCQFTKNNQGLQRFQENPNLICVFNLYLNTNTDHDSSHLQQPERRLPSSASMCGQRRRLEVQHDTSNNKYLV